MSTMHMFEWMTEHGFMSPYTSSNNYKVQDQFAKLRELAEWSHMLHIGRMICGIRIGIVMQWVIIFCVACATSSDTPLCDPSDVDVFRLTYAVSSGGLHMMCADQCAIWKQLCVGVHDGTLRNDYIVVFDVHASYHIS